MSLAGVLHLVSAMGLVFALMPVATAVLMRAFAADVRWRSLGAATGLTSAATGTLLVGGIALMSPPGQPPRIGDEYAGLIQRIDVVVFLAWQLAVARRLARVRPTTSGATPDRRGRTAP
jgi:hypothetical protein